MYRLLTLLIALLPLTTLTAQNTKFGKPTKEEWDLTSVSFAPDADAVVLYKSVDVTYSLNSSFSAYGSGGEGSLEDNGYGNAGVNKYISPDLTSMDYDVKVRIKILKDSGAIYSAMDILSFNDKNDMNMRDDIYEMSVVVFTNTDGKVKKKRLSNANIKNERIDDYYCIRHIRIPDVKAGDIIEYQYKMFSNRITYIFDTQLQENIPVLHARCCLDIPYFLQFDVNKPEAKNVIATAALGQILMRDPNATLQNPRKCITNVYTIKAFDVPPFDGTIDLQNITNGKVFTVRTALKDKRFDVKPDVSGPARHLVIGK